MNNFLLSFDLASGNVAAPVLALVRHGLHALVNALGRNRQLEAELQRANAEIARLRAVNPLPAVTAKGPIPRLGPEAAKAIDLDAPRDERFFRGAGAKTGPVTPPSMPVPRAREGQSLGARHAIPKKSGAWFSQAGRELLLNMADSAALVIENARLTADLDNSYNNTLDALIAALDLRDRETEGHSRRVVEYTTRLACALDVPREQVAVMRRGALLHDIGKIGVPDAVLHKTGALTPAERAVIEQHPQAGYEMLMGIPYLLEESQIVLAHQEKWDGNGYPFGLKGEAIPLGARLFSIADTFDALLSDRPYRKGRPYLVAREIIAAEAGHQFDPQAVAAFLAINPEEWDRIRTEVMAHVVRRRQLHENSMRGVLTTCGGRAAASGTAAADGG